MEQEDRNILAALRQEPEQTAFLIKFSLVAAAVIVAWDVLASMVLPVPVVKAVAVLLIFAYGATIVFVVARIMASVRGVGYVPATSPRLTASAATRRLDRSAPAESDEYAPAADDERTPPHVANRPQPDAVVTMAPPIFNEQYFMMRLHEQVKDARRDGRQMCVAAIEVTVPGGEASPEEIDRIGLEMARIGSQQWKIIGQPLAVSESEYIFSLPASNADEARLFVREIVQALGEYWCHFGIAMFPRHATDAEGLVEQARDACEVSRQGGKQPKSRYPLSA